MFEEYTEAMRQTVDPVDAYVPDFADHNDEERDETLAELETVRAAVLAWA